MEAPKEKKKFTNTHRQMMKIRNIKPSEYELVKETYGCLYIRHKVTGMIKILNKSN